MALKNFEVESCKPTANVQKLADGGGLYLEVRPSGNKYWRYRYRIDGKENVFNIGEHGARADQFTLATARIARGEAAKLVKQGVHPRSFQRKEFAQRVMSERNTFAATAAEWLATRHAKVEAGLLTAHYVKQCATALERDLAPLNECLLRDIRSSQILAILETRAHVPRWALLVRRVCSDVFTFAILKERCDFDPTYALRDVIGAKAHIELPKAKNNPHLLLSEVPDFLAAVRAADETGDPELRVVKLALQLQFLTLVRPNEMIEARWEEFDLAAARWNIPGERMKMGVAHVVPLSQQVLTMLRELHALTGDTPFLFPERNARKRTGLVPKLPNILARFIRYRTAYAGRVTPHGFRGTASTVLNELQAADKRPRFASDWIEAQLAHRPRGVMGMYNHAVYLEQRAEMLQFYADLVAPQGAKVRTLRSAA